MLVIGASDHTTKLSQDARNRVVLGYGTNELFLSPALPRCPNHTEKL